MSSAHKPRSGFEIDAAADTTRVPGPAPSVGPGQQIARSGAYLASLKSFASGVFGGFCITLVGHPLDLLKVRMQTMVVEKGQKPPFSGMLDCGRQTIQKEGFQGLYRGVSAPLANNIPVYALCFWSYDLGKKLVSRIGGNEGQELSIGQIVVAGGFSAIPTTIVMAPGERIKCLLQIQADAVQKGIAPQYSGFRDCASQLLRSGGLRNLFVGWEATLVRDIPGSMAYFGVYEYIKRSLSSDKQQLSPLAVLCAGGFAGVGNWVVSIPPDVIKSRIQTAPAGTYRGMIHATQVLLEKEGPGALYKGIGPAMVRAFPANASCFLGYELASSFLNWLLPTD